MKLPQELLLKINETLTRSHGPDIAHDVVVALLRRRNPIRKPLRWARAYAAGLANRESSSFRQPRVIVMSDLPSRLNNIMYGYVSQNINDSY
jgi:hypothetical protein